ncbi:MAG: hypothetical protein ABI405_09645 [Parafilimonas sp.]
MRKSVFGVHDKTTLLFNLLFLGLLMILVSCNQKKSAAVADTKKPDDNRFTPVVLTAQGDFDEPLNFEVLKNGKVFINERKG